MPPPAWQTVRVLHALPAMRPIALMSTLLAAACAMPVTSSAGGTAGDATPAGSSIALDLVNATNAARARNGLPSLAVNAKLMEAARIHARQMAAYQRADHVISGAQYPTPVSRIQAVDYAYRTVGENVAWNQPDAARVMSGWMSSSAHRANILNPEFIEMGAAMARSDSGEPYWIQVFGAPR